MYLPAAQTSLCVKESVHMPAISIELVMFSCLISYHVAFLAKTFYRYLLTREEKWKCFGQDGMVNAFGLSGNVFHLVRIIFSPQISKIVMLLFNK